MPPGTILDSDVAIIGTGLAALVAASRLIREGRSVLVLNPDSDFFREDSELPFDPLLGTGISGARWKASSAEALLEELRPDFPGSLESWTGDLASASAQFQDPVAPFVRARGRLWMDSEAIDSVFLESSDAGLKPQLMDGISVLGRLPGFVGARTRSEEWEGIRGTWVPRLGDVDVRRYRGGVLEFVRERMGAARMLPRVSSLGFTPEGVRFHSPEGGAKSVRIREGILVFWTPRLHSWIQSELREAGVKILYPAREQAWEEWTLVSRDRLPPGVMGVSEDLVFWADGEGNPDADPSSGNRLAVLRSAKAAASDDSFRALSRLCHDRLKWDRFSIRSLRTRMTLEWDFPEGTHPWIETERGGTRLWFHAQSDGPISQVVRTARRAVEVLEQKESHS